MQLIPEASLALNLIEKKKARKKEKKFVVEGEHLVEEAQGQISFVLYSKELPILKRLKAGNIKCLKVSEKVFEKLSQVETPQGILAVVKEFEHNLKGIIKGPKRLLVFCVGIQDPGNLGTIIRSADAANAGGVILSKETVDLYNPKVIRSSMGSVFHLPVVCGAETAPTLEMLKKNGVKVVSGYLKAKRKIWEVDLKGPVALLVGNEAAGLPKEITEYCDEVVSIPMPGRAESLNVAMSASIMLYEAVRQRGV